MYRSLSDVTPSAPAALSRPAPAGLAVMEKSPRERSVSALNIRRLLLTRGAGKSRVTTIFPPEEGSESTRRPADSSFLRFRQRPIQGSSSRRHREMKKALPPNNKHPGGQGNRPCSIAMDKDVSVSARKMGESQKGQEGEAPHLQQTNMRQRQELAKLIGKLKGCQGDNIERKRWRTYGADLVWIFWKEIATTSKGEGNDGDSPRNRATKIVSTRP